MAKFVKVFNDDQDVVYINMDKVFGVIVSAGNYELVDEDVCTIMELPIEDNPDFISKLL